MKNKKGFTLVELLAVVALLAVIAVIAIPNVINMVDSGRKEQFVTDAKTMISRAKYMIKLEKYSGLFSNVLAKDGSCSEISAVDLDVELNTSADGNAYVLDKSYVKVCFKDSRYVYSVKMCSTNSGRGISSSEETYDYVEEKYLSKSYVYKVNECK